MEIIFLSGEKNVMGHFVGFFEGAPSKNPAKCPIICFAREQKKIISRTFNISGTLSSYSVVIKKIPVFNKCN
jgi:hypothetical protein